MPKAAFLLYRKYRQITKGKRGQKKSIGLNEPGVKNKKDGEMCAGQAVEKIKSRF